MHSSAYALLWLLAAQVSPNNFAPVEDLQFQPVPMSVELNAPTEPPTFQVPKSSRIRHTVPATPLDEPTALPPQAQASPIPTTSVLRNRDGYGAAQVNHNEPIGQFNNVGQVASEVERSAAGS